MHELAHFIITEKNVPILGPVENAADYIATLALIREEPLDPAQEDRAEQFLLATAGAFEASWEAGTRLGAEVPYWGEHALSIQRYYNIACLLYGSDPAAFASVPQRAGMPATRAQSCIAEYARAAAAFDWLIGAYGRRPGEPLGMAIEIVYEPPPTTVSASVVRALKSIELLERITKRLQQGSRWTGRSRSRCAAAANLRPPGCQSGASSRSVTSSSIRCTCSGCAQPQRTAGSGRRATADERRATRRSREIRPTAASPSCRT